MRFRLSTAQRKDLLIRGIPLRIALPAPADDPPDWFPWAKRALGEEGIYLRNVVVESILVAPPSGGGLTGVIGRIVHDEDSNAENLTWLIEVVLCDLNPPTKPRHRRKRPQWPQSAEHNGQKWPAPPVKEGEPVTAIVFDELHPVED
jgi:hypothetical protein